MGEGFFVPTEIIGTQNDKLFLLEAAWGEYETK